MIFCILYYDWLYWLLYDLLYIYDFLILWIILKSYYVLYYNRYILLYIVHTVIIEDIQELSENRSSIWNGFGRAEKAISNRR